MDWKSIAQKQVDILDTSLSSIDRSAVDGLLSRISATSKPLYFTGVGKNGHIARAAAATFDSMSIRSIFIDPIDAVHGGMGCFLHGGLLIATSKSGNTDELITMLGHVKKTSMHVTLIHSNTSARIISEGLCDSDIYVPVERELDPINMVPTASLITYAVLLQAIACHEADRRGFCADAFCRNHPGGDIGRKLRA